MNPFAALALTEPAAPPKKSNMQPSVGFSKKTNQAPSYQPKQYKQAPAKVNKGVNSKKFNNKPYVPYTPNSEKLSYEERQYAPPKTQSFGLMSFTTTGLPISSMTSLVKPPGPSLPLKPTTIISKKAVITKDQLNRMPYIFDIIDKAEYEKIGSSIDPRDLAYLYIIAAERVMQNILYPLALALGATEELKQIEVFNALVMKTEKIEQKLQEVTNIATKAQFLLAIEIYRKRLRIVKPKQFSPNIIYPDVILTQIRAVLITKFVNGMEISEEVKEKLQKIAKSAKFKNVNSSKPVPASVDRPSTFPDGELVNSSLALLMVQNFYGLDELVDIRNELAHNGGDSQDIMYESMVENIFDGKTEMKNFLMLNSVYTPKYNVDEY